MNTFIRTSIYVLVSACVLPTISLHARMQTDVPTHINESYTPAQKQIGGIPSAVPPGGMPGLPQMSDAEMKQLEAELAELNTMLEGLSPEEQEQVLETMVQEAMEEVKKDLSDEGKELLDKLESGDITDADFEKLLNELMPAEGKKEEAPASAVPAKKVEPKFVITSKHQEALDRINSLINHTNLFIQKAGTIPELPGTISKWEREKKIEWQPKLTWNTFRADLDMLVSKLEQLKTQDQKTERYIHLDALLKNEALYSNIGKVEKLTAEFEPQLQEVAPIGGQKIPESSKRALQKLLTQYVEAIYILKLSQALDTLFAEFEPRAKELREEEEKSTKAAQAEQKKTRLPGHAVTAGVPESRYAPPFDPYEDLDFTGYDDTPQGVFIPTYEPPKQDSFLPTSRPKAPTPQKASPSLAGGKKPQEKEKSGDTLTESELADKQVAISSLPNGSQAQESQSAMSPRFKQAVDKENKMFESISKPLGEIATMIKDNKIVSALDADLKNAGSYSQTLVEELLPDLYGQLRKAERSLSSFSSSLASQPAHIKKQMGKELKEKTKKSLDSINTLINKISTAQAGAKSLPLEKQYLYFGPIDKDEYMATILERELSLADSTHYLVIWNTNGASFANSMVATQQFIAAHAPSAAVQQALRNMSGNLENLVRVEQAVPQPTRVPSIQQIATSIKQTISAL